MTVIAREKIINGNERYVLIDDTTGEIIDDAQGYGYRTPRKAHAAYAYKNRNTKKDPEYTMRKIRLKNWMNEHQELQRAIERGYASCTTTVNARFVRKLLTDLNLSTEFTPVEILVAYNKEQDW